MITLKSEVSEAREKGDDKSEYQMTFVSKHFGKYVRKLEKKGDKFRCIDDKSGGNKKDNFFWRSKGKASELSNTFEISMSGVYMTWTHSEQLCSYSAVKERRYDCQNLE